MGMIRNVGIETAAAAVVMIPILLIWKHFCLQSLKRWLCYTMFALYLSAVYAVVGLPSILYIRFHLTVNLIPFVTIAGDLKNSILNIILFIPLGFALPLLCDKFMSVKRVILLGFGTSLFIEFGQIFTYRATDVNDLIMNTAGTMIGFIIVKVFMVKKQRVILGKNDRELYILIAIVFAVMFFIQPFISKAFWNLVL